MVCYIGVPARTNPQEIERLIVVPYVMHMDAAQVTAIHQLITALVQAAAAAEAKSQFLARMSHEIRTPLNGMIAVGQLLAETALSPAQWDLVNTVRCSGETLLTLISDILDFSRIEARLSRDPFGMPASSTHLPACRCPLACRGQRAASQHVILSLWTRLNVIAKDLHKFELLQANKMVLCTAPFRLSSVIEAAMEIAGPGAAMKRLQVRLLHCAEFSKFLLPCYLYSPAQQEVLRVPLCAFRDGSLHDSVQAYQCCLHGDHKDELLPQSVHNPPCAQQSAFPIHACLIVCRWPITLPRGCLE